MATYQERNAVETILHAYGVEKYLTYTTGTTPHPIDSKDLSRRIVAAGFRCEDKDVLKELQDLESDFSEDSEEVVEWMEKSEGLILNLAQGYGEAMGIYNRSVTKGMDLSDLSKDELVSLAEDLFSVITERLPQPRLGENLLREHLTYRATGITEKFKFLKYSSFHYDSSLPGWGCNHTLTKDNTVLRVRIMNGSVVFSTFEATMTISGDYIIFSHNRKGMHKFPLVDYQAYFDDWLAPTQDEFSLLEMMVPGFHCDILKMLIGQNPK